MGRYPGFGRSGLLAVAACAVAAAALHGCSTVAAYSMRASVPDGTGEALAGEAVIAKAGAGVILIFEKSGSYTVFKTPKSSLEGVKALARIEDGRLCAAGKNLACFGADGAVSWQKDLFMGGEWISAAPGNTIVTAGVVKVSMTNPDYNLPTFTQAPFKDSLVFPPPTGGVSSFSDAFGGQLYISTKVKRFDYGGNMTQEVTLPMGLRAMASDGDGFLAAGIVSSGTSNQTIARILRLDSGFKASWYHDFDFLPSITDLNDTVAIVRHESGEITMVGSSAPDPTNTFGTPKSVEGKLFIIRMDAGGNIRWRREMPSGLWPKPLAAGTPGGGLIVVSPPPPSSGAQGEITTIKINSSGEAAWITAAGKLPEKILAGAFDGGSLYLSGLTADGNVVIRKFNGDTGAPIWEIQDQAGLGHESAIELPGSLPQGAWMLTATTGGNLMAVASGRSKTSGSEAAKVVMIDTTGMVVWTKNFP